MSVVASLSTNIYTGHYSEDLRLEAEKYVLRDSTGRPIKKTHFLVGHVRSAKELHHAEQRRIPLRGKMAKMTPDERASIFNKKWDTLPAHLRTKYDTMVDTAMTTLLTGDTKPIPFGLGNHATMSACLRFAIAKRGRTWAPNDESEIGDLTKYIWGEYVKIYASHKQRHVDRLAAEKVAKKLADKKMWAEAAHKRKIKELAEIKRIGRPSYVDRMKKDKAVKNSKPVKASIHQELPFNKWLKSSDYLLGWKTRLIDLSKISFSRLPLLGGTKETIHVNEATAIETLSELSKHSSAKTISVAVQVSWDEYAETRGHLTAHVRHTDGLLNMEGFRSSPGDTIPVIGFEEIDGKSYITTPDTMATYRLLPKKFKPFEARNPKIATTMRQLWQVPHGSIVSIVVKTSTKTVSMQIRRTSSCDGLSSDEIIGSLFPIDSAAYATARAIEIKRAEMTARATTARTAGLARKEQHRIAEILRKTNETLDAAHVAKLRCLTSLLRTGSITKELYLAELMTLSLE